MIKFFLRLKYRFFPPVIDTPFGPVSEGPRRQAAENMKGDPKLKAEIVNMLGEKEAKRRYPEAWL